MASIAKNLAALPKNDSKPSTIVVTQGADPTIVCVGGVVTEYFIVALPKEKLVDTNGAVDTYVGGFLSGLVQEKSVAHSCAAGTYAASGIVRQSSCTFPPKAGLHDFRLPPRTTLKRQRKSILANSSRVKDLIEGNTFLPIAGWMGANFVECVRAVAVVKDCIEGNTFLPISGWMGANSSNEGISDGCRGEGFPPHFWLDGCQVVE